MIRFPDVWVCHRGNDYVRLTNRQGLQRFRSEIPAHPRHRQKFADVVATETQQTLENAIVTHPVNRSSFQ
jgi:hypothetical protein